MIAGEIFFLRVNEVNGFKLTERNLIKFSQLVAHT